ncbi:MAG TPA: OmpA family protein [Stellaceae bacterium]|nr:OmpA family protein [Stellaceae bacterium]
MRHLIAALGLCLVLGAGAPTAAALERPLGSIDFAPGSVAISAVGQRALDRLAVHLGTDTAMRVELLAYASGSDRDARAHRLSLARAQALRGYLMARGVKMRRVILRPLGNGPAGADRVDVLALSR